MNKWSTIFIVLSLMLVSCGRTNDSKSTAKEDLAAKNMLQGIWVDDDTEIPLMRIKGDTIYYADPQNAPVSFKIIRDTIYINGNTPIAYKIDKHNHYSFWFHSMTEDVVKLHRSENPDDSLAFANQIEVIPTITEVVKKDSVVMYKNTRYRGYVYINPSKMRVTKTTYSEEGMGVDNVYYDNIIHICVYEGKKLLYGKDIKKQMFVDLFSSDFLDQAVLADMKFMGVNNKGYHYQAILNIPETYISGIVNLTIDSDNKLTMKKLER